MKSRRLFLGIIIACVACLAACKKEKPLSPIPDSLASLRELFNPTYQISTDSIYQIIHSYLDENKQETPWDSALVAHYREKDEFFWLNDSLISDKPAVQAADSMLYWLENISRHGINPYLYPADGIHFTRNRMMVYDNKTGLQVDPHSIKWAKYAGKGVPYTVKQDNKTGNSLERIIFRFPNPHSVYLHDTPSHWAFTRKNRAVSHGCVRFQKALDFSFFLLNKQDSLLEDRIRIAMDIKPVTEEGKKLPVSAAYRELKHYSLEKYIPLFIDYQTVYLSADNNLRYCEDIYKYDPSILKAMSNLNLKL